MKETLSRERKETLFRIAEEQMRSNGIEPENPHGMEHVRRVYGAFENFYAAGCEIRGIDLQLLEIAIILHDTGRGIESLPEHQECRGNHAFISEKLFRTYPISWINSQEKETVSQAIRWHNKGLRNRGIEYAKTVEDATAQFLVLFDCIDGLHVPRIKAWAEENGIPEWDDSLLSGDAAAFLESGQKVPETIKGKGLLNNLLFNLNLLSEDEEVISPIRQRIVNYEAFRKWLESEKEPVRKEIGRIMKSRQQKARI